MQRSIDSSKHCPGLAEVQSQPNKRYTPLAMLMRIIGRKYDASQAPAPVDIVDGTRSG